MNSILSQLGLFACLVPVLLWALRFQHRASIETALEVPPIAPTLPSPERPERPRLEVVSPVPRAKLAARYVAARERDKALKPADLRGLAEYDAQRHSNGAAE